MCNTKYYWGVLTRLTFLRIMCYENMNIILNVFRFALHSSYWLVFKCSITVSNVYWTVYHCNNWRMKDQLDVTVVLQPAKRTPPNISRNKNSNTQRTEVCKSQIHIKKYINKALNTKQPMKKTTHKRTQWSQSIIDSGQNQLKYTYQLQQGDKTHHTKTHHYTP